VYGAGTQTRSFCYVTDLIEGLTRLMNADSELDEAVNLGNPHEVTMLDLARLVISLVGSRSRIEFRPLPADDPRQRCPDISRAERLLHWTPKVPLEEGLTNTIEYFDTLLAGDAVADRYALSATS
jgi:UDP-glucuronate decarboxylase